MKSVLISIQPKWCELIASGKKTIEVRKTKPKIDTPFKCYIYCTKNKHGWFDFLHKTKLDGKVIGEFVCDEIINAIQIGGDEFYATSCMNFKDWMKYTDNHKGDVWCWHISDLVIYDKPKELRMFHKPCVVNPCINKNFCSGGTQFCTKCTITRPPQSWCYVETQH